MMLHTAWVGYLASGRLTDDTWTVLTDVYSAMVNRLEPHDQDEAAPFRANQLGGHLINRLWHGQIDLDSPDGLLNRYYAHASTEIANDLLRAIGVSLHEQKTADAGLVDRLTALWEFRIAAVRNGADPAN
jgi:hypothetical protein